MYVCMYVCMCIYTYIHTYRHTYMMIIIILLKYLLLYTNDNYTSNNTNNNDPLWPESGEQGAFPASPPISAQPSAATESVNAGRAYITVYDITCYLIL